MDKKKSISTCMLICLVSTLYSCSDSAGTSKEDTTHNEVSVTDNYDDYLEETPSTSYKAGINSEVIQSTDDKIKGITIDFKLSNSDILENNYSTYSEINLNRPSILKGSEVFIGWEEQDVISSIEDNTYQAGEVVSLTVDTIDITNTPNAIYNDTIFSSSSEEFVEIPIIIGGDTNFSILDLEVTFDKEFFSFDSITYSDNDVACNYTDDGKLLISFVSTSNVTADVNLCNVKLKKIKTEEVETKLHYNIKDIAAWNNDCTDYTSVRYEVVNDLIVMY
ncbi:MAG: hypothetical protein IKW87_12810 [Ruminococcus sp.]|nr:hypothetical protein [Ruminococcus sp.]